MYSEWEYTETGDCCKEDYYLFYEYDPAPRPPKNIRKEGRMSQNLKSRLDRMPWYTSGFL